MHTASTTRARSLGITLTPMAMRTASVTTLPAALTPPSMIPRRAPQAPLQPESTTRARSSGTISIPPIRSTASFSTLTAALTPPSMIPWGVKGTLLSGINGTGQIVGLYYDSGGITHGFLLSGGTYTTLDDPLATNGTFARNIDDAGQIVGLYNDANGTHGFFLTITPNTPPP